MIISARQLKDKVRNLSKEKSADAQILLRCYMMERFLERVSISRYNKNFILKGGMLIASMVGFEARSTMDIDTTVRGETVSANKIKDMIKEIIPVNLSDGVSFITQGISNIMDEAEYPGIRVSMTAFMDGVRVPLKIDISTGDVITPRAVEYSYKLMFEDRSILLLAYNLETILAEKLETIIARTTTNTRMRDFYDIHILSSLYWPEINPTILSDALKATSYRRGSLDLLDNSEKVLTSLHDDSGMQALWQNYRSKFNYAADTSWASALRSVRRLAISAGLRVKKPSVIESLHESLSQTNILSVHRDRNTER